MSEYQYYAGMNDPERIGRLARLFKGDPHVAAELRAIRERHVRKERFLERITDLGGEAGDPSV